MNTIQCLTAADEGQGLNASCVRGGDRPEILVQLGHPQESRRLMREHGLQPKSRRQQTTTTDSDHDEPIFPKLSKDLKPNGPDQLWVADITDVPVIGGFVYVAIVLDAWSRRVVGYAMSRSIDARVTLAALGATVADRKLLPSCVHHSDRGSQYAAKAYRYELAARGLKGSMGRRGNPYDNAKAERAS